jgi:hypothetical protein
MLCVSALSIIAETAYDKKMNEIIQKYFSIFKYGYQRPLSNDDRMAIAY